MIVYHKLQKLETKENMEIVTIAGNRPEIIKLAELVKLLGDNYKNAFVYTGQHFSHNMRDLFFEELNVKFDYDLASNTSDISVLRANIRELLQRIKPSYVIVYGDTNSTVAGALAAKDMNCKVFHIEAGLRCFDLSKPEERNRILVDSVSDYFLPPTELSKLFLRYENVPENEIFVTGNLIVDICKKFYHAIEDSGRKSNFYDNYILLTLHRPALVDNPTMLRILSKFLAKIDHKIIFPMHPRTKNSLAKYGIRLPENVKAIDALGYSDFLALLKDSTIVLTDSGGVQEEAIILKKPCITLNNTTERQETILLKANRLFYPLDGESQNSSINDLIGEMIHTKIGSNPYGENVTSKAYNVISNIIDTSTPKIRVA
jgi:UDP-N-acetylglucosamine 2-epimerase